MKKKIEFASHPANLWLVRHCVRQFLQNRAFSSREIDLMVLGVDEACTNIIRHAYHLAEDQLISLSLETIKSNGVRFHLVMKTSMEETTRLMVAVLQQQLRGVGIVLDIRAFESATFMADVVSGAYQMYSLRWIGGNEDPDIFEYVFHSDKFPPHGANRSFYVNPRIDALIKEGRSETDPGRRKAVYANTELPQGAVD